MVELKVVQLEASDMENFSYLVYCPETLQGAAIDPSTRPEVLLDAASQLGVTLALLLNTHGHQDHTRGNSEILASGDIKLGAHPDEVPNPDILLIDEMRIGIGNGFLTVMHTPGHSPGSVIFAGETFIVSGDTLFVGRCGRADLIGSDVKQLYASLQRLKKLPPTTRVYPGHNYGPLSSSTIAWELENNPFLKCADLESFTALRMG